MTLTDRLRGLNHPQAEPAPAAKPAGPPAPIAPGPVATTTAAIADATEAYYASRRALWVPSDVERPLLSELENARALLAMDIGGLCVVCAPRYSQCYAFNHGGGRG